jgi:hypothetical protein
VAACLTAQRTINAEPVSAHARGHDTVRHLSHCQLLHNNDILSDLKFT